MGSVSLLDNFRYTRDESLGYRVSFSFHEIAPNYSIPIILSYTLQLLHRSVCFTVGAVVHSPTLERSEYDQHRHAQVMLFDLSIHAERGSISLFIIGY